MGRKGRYYGFELSRSVREACKYTLKTYPHLITVRKGLEDISGYKKHYTDKVINKVALEQKIHEMDEALMQIPGGYREAVKYLLFSSETNAIKEFRIEAVFGKDYQETVIWMEKLFYLYAKIAGYPVSTRGIEHEVIIDDDGNIEVVR